MDIEQAIQLYLQDIQARRLSPQTYRRYEDDLALMRQSLHAQQVGDLAAVRVDHLRAYLADLQARSNAFVEGRPLSAFTVESRYRSLKAFWGWCTDDGLVSPNPAAHIRRPKTPKRIVSRLSEDQVNQLLDVLQGTKSPQRNLAVVLLMVGSGLRRGEVVNLKLSDVDLRAGKVTVIGKGDKEREVPLGPAIIRALRLWFLARPLTSSDRVFVNADGTPFEAEGVRSLLGRMRKQLGLKRLYPHLLRHTFAKLYLKRGDHKSLQKILGHEKASTTLDLYVDFEFDDLKEIYDRSSPIDSILRTAAPETKPREERRPPGAPPPAAVVAAIPARPAPAKHTAAASVEGSDRESQVPAPAAIAAQAARRRGRPARVSFFRGVSWSESSHAWRARVEANGRTVEVGYYDDELAAALARDQAAVEHQGAKVRLNFAPDDPRLPQAIEALGRVPDAPRIRTCPHRQKRDGASSSHFVGVSWDRNAGKWRAAICFQGHKIHLGRFADEEEAAAARQAAERKYWAPLDPRPAGEGAPAGGSASAESSPARAAESAGARSNSPEEKVP